MADVSPPPAPKTVPAPRDQHLRDLADCIRFLSMDAVQQAKSGHPGAPMGMADIATVLFKDFMQFDAADPHWIDRDRFILSNGHGSMLLYSLLLPARLQGHAAGGAEALPPGRLQDPRPSRIPPCRRHRDDDRPARPGHRQFRRLRARRAHHERQVRRRPAATIAPMSSWATAASWKASARKRSPSPAISSSAT